MKTRIRIGRRYRFVAAGWDRFQRHASTPENGTIVVPIKSPRGCPPFGAMGHGYVATPEGKFIGLVHLNSLTEENA